MRLALSAFSRTGARSINEDACGCWTGEGLTVCVVADGAGGHRGGDLASKIVVASVLEHFRDDPRCDPSVIQAALAVANDKVLAAQRNDQTQSDMRATAVVLAIDAQRELAIWGNLGDSRLYGFRDGGAFTRTRDHSLVQRMVEAGYLRPDEVRTSPHRSQLFGALGAPDTFEPYVVGAPWGVLGGDAFLLCTDGCWEQVDDAEISRMLEEAESPDSWLRRLEQVVSTRGRDRLDNYSAMALWCEASESM